MGLFEGLVGAVIGGVIDGAIGTDPIGQGVVLGGILGSLIDIDTKKQYTRMEMFEILKREYKAGNIGYEEYSRNLDKLISSTDGATFTINKD